MKIPAQLQKIISVLMSFIMMIEFSGCYTKRILSTSDITPSKYFLIHCKYASYPAYNTTITDGIFTGNIDFNNKDLTNPLYVHIYLISDSSFKVNNSQFTLPITSIKEISQSFRDQKKTRTLIAILVVGVSVGFIVGLTISLASLFRPPTPNPSGGQDWCEYLQSIEACSDGSPK
jgi:hypothetical protein